MSSRNEANYGAENTVSGQSQRRRPVINFVLWTIQVLLALLFLWAGGIKLVMPLEQLAGPVALPGAFIRFIGVAEVLGAFGLILPWLLRIRPSLTPLAAAGLIIIMIGATTITLIGGSVPMAIMPVVVGLLLAFVTYGRVRLTPAPYRRSSGSPKADARFNAISTGV